MALVVLACEQADITQGTNTTVRCPDWQMVELSSLQNSQGMGTPLPPLGTPESVEIMGLTLLFMVSAFVAGQLLRQFKRR